MWTACGAWVASISNVVVALPSCTDTSPVCSPGETVATGVVIRLGEAELPLLRGWVPQREFAFAFSGELEGKRRRGTIGHCTGGVLAFVAGITRCHDEDHAGAGQPVKLLLDGVRAIVRAKVRSQTH